VKKRKDHPEEIQHRSAAPPGVFIVLVFSHELGPHGGERMRIGRAPKIVVRHGGLGVACEPGNPIEPRLSRIPQRVATPTLRDYPGTTGIANIQQETVGVHLQLRSGFIDDEVQVVIN
jgi:hypothetical protein